MKEIKLTQGHVTVVDDADYKIVNSYKWRYLNGYAKRTFTISGVRRNIALHRFLLSALPGQIVDHKNGNGLDNRRGNLRICTSQESAYNRRPRVGSKSGIKGVNFLPKRNKWRAIIAAQSKRTYLGYFDTQKEAMIAYNEASLRLHGEFARLNSVV